MSVTEITVAEANINLVPQKLDLHLYAGDGVTLRLTFAQQGTAIPMDGGVMTAQVRTNRNDTTPVADWAVDATNAQQGIVVLSLTGAQTAAIMESYMEQEYWFSWRGSWDVQWQPTGLEPMTLFQGDVYCSADVTR